MSHDRRSVLAALGLLLPLGFPGRSAAAQRHRPPALRLRSFEVAVREAFATVPAATASEPFPCRRIEVGHSELLATGVQGCHNDRPFAGFPPGRLRIVRTGSEPGPVVCGVRLFVSTVDVALAGGPEYGTPTRPLDFSILPPAPRLVEGAGDALRPTAHGGMASGPVSARTRKPSIGVPA
jgi:hypothetical protein